MVQSPASTQGHPAAGLHPSAPRSAEGCPLVLVSECLRLGGSLNMHHPKSPVLASRSLAHIGDTPSRPPALGHRSGFHLPSLGRFQTQRSTSNLDNYGLYYCFLSLNRGQITHLNTTTGGSPQAAGAVWGEGPGSTWVGGGRVWGRAQRCTSWSLGDRPAGWAPPGRHPDTAVS